jgi:hypothetical protein
MVESGLVDSKIEVRFRNPFYHNVFGLLGAQEDSDTIYTLPSSTVLPETAIVVKGESSHRDRNPPRRAQRKDGRFVGVDTDLSNAPESEEGGAAAGVVDVPSRKTPTGGKDKEIDVKPRKRKANKPRNK